MPSERLGDWIETRYRDRFWPMDARPEDIDIRDIAHALSRQCRFGGHTRGFLSVAQHSVMVSYECQPRDALWGLLHDASEAYLLDLPRPIKHLPEMQPYRDAEARLMLVICRRFLINPKMPVSVSAADECLLATEARQQMRMADPGWHAWTKGITPLPERIRSWPSWYARWRFLRRFRELTTTPTGEVRG